MTVSGQSRASNLGALAEGVLVSATCRNRLFVSASSGASPSAPDDADTIRANALATPNTNALTTPNTNALTQRPIPTHSQHPIPTHSQRLPAPIPCWRSSVSLHTLGVGWGLRWVEGRGSGDGCGLAGHSLSQHRSFFEPGYTC